MAIEIYIVEDHPIMRESLEMYLRALHGLSVCGAAESAEEALAQIPDTPPDLVLVDMSLPGISGAELIARLRERIPDLRCLVLSGHGESTYVQQAFASGARGYVMKGDFDELKQAIDEVTGGEVYVSAALQGV